MINLINPKEENKNQDFTVQVDLVDLVVLVVLVVLAVLVVLVVLADQQADQDQADQDQADQDQADQTVLDELQTINRSHIYIKLFINFKFKYFVNYVVMNIDV